ncbi:MAG: hypothetical protein B6244_14125 [Candidatus Cloacimonetes bacterium 4572_55]|nr:MAG: hypothetical protein B6244_14125 [Candidatus Cloacimonetes bacterium 4572_55]
MAKRLVDTTKIVTGLAPVTPSTSTPDYVSMKDFSHLTIILSVDNGSTVTGSAITVSEATAVAGTNAQTLTLTKMWANTDTAATDALTETAVISNTFTTDTTDAKNLLYVIEVEANELSSGFDCLAVTAGDAANMVLSATYILSGARYLAASTAITD